MTGADIKECEAHGPEMGHARAAAWSSDVRWFFVVLESGIALINVASRYAGYSAERKLALHRSIFATRTRLTTGAHKEMGMCELWRRLSMLGRLARRGAWYGFGRFSRQLDMGTDPCLLPPVQGTKAVMTGIIPTVRVADCREHLPESVI